MSGPVNVEMGKELTTYPGPAPLDPVSSDSQPTTNNSRWCKVSEWAKNHKKELFIAAAIIGIIAGAIITGGGIALLAIVGTTLAKTAAVTAGGVSVASLGMTTPFFVGFFMTVSGPSVIAFNIFMLQRQRSA